jgi:anti-sigma factor RsiW
MSCTVENDLTAFVDGELSAADMARVRKHLEGCAECRATVALLQRTVETLAALPAFQPSVGLRRRVLTRVETLPPSWSRRLREWFRPAVLLPSGMGVALAAVLALVAVRQAAEQRRSLELAVASNYELLSDYEVVGLSPDDLEVVEHLDELEAGR